jgi:hypothetical protein
MSNTEENERKELCRKIDKGNCGSPYLQGYLSAIVLSHSIPLREARNIASAVEQAVKIAEGKK